MLFERRHWQWVRLYGNWWWHPAPNDADVAEAKSRLDEAVAAATTAKASTETIITQRLLDGWEIVAVIPVVPRGYIDRASVHARQYCYLYQEAWSVFLQRRLGPGES